MTPLVSIIIPVYNSEKFIGKCVDSVLMQTYKNIEIILVDDGSTDNSPAICDEYSSKHRNIIVVHKCNEGVSRARNTGIDTSNGDYLCFIDGDDYISEKHIEEMINIAVKENSDIVTTNAYKTWTDGKVEELLFNDLKPMEHFNMTGKQTLCEMLYGKTCYASCWSKLYKKDIFEDIRFPSLSMGEDSFTMYHCLLKAEKVSHLRSPTYFYVQHPQSVMHSNNFDKFYDYIKLSDDFINIVKNNSYNDLFLPAVNRLIENNFWVYMKMRTNKTRYSAQLKHITRNIKKYRGYAMKDKNVCSRTRLACLISYGGMNLLNFIYDLKK